MTKHIRIQIPIVDLEDTFTIEWTNYNLKGEVDIRKVTLLKHLPTVFFVKADTPVLELPPDAVVI